MEPLKLALDWTPNINHLGFFIARDKGFYRTLGLEVDIINPSQDNYATTPAKQVELGLVDFALCPTESIISYRTKDRPFDLIAIAAILQADLSAIVVKSDAGIHSPRDLDGKIYASYGARYEDGIVKEMIRNDGGTGNINITYPAKLGIWNRLLSGESDATWVFLNWEGVEVQQRVDQFTYFKMSDYQIPYSYSPVIATSESRMVKKLASYRAFIQATKQGFLYSQGHPDEAVTILSKYVPAHDRKVNLLDALAATTSYFGDANSWGVMQETTVDQFMRWIKEKGLEKKDIKLADIYTLACLG